MSVELAVVIPVYNEEACIIDVVQAWAGMLKDQGISCHLLLLNDGSTDGTKERLTVFENDPKIEVIHKPNSGHGPTILQGYHQAVEMADWVFQCDSDDEMKDEHFPNLWNHRTEYDALFGIRYHRKQNLSRKIITYWSRWTVRLWFGPGVTDVNTPYRLIRADVLKQFIQQIPENTVAPNVIISGALGRARCRIYDHRVPHNKRRTGQVSIANWKLLKLAVRAFWQTIHCRPSLSDEQPS